MPNSTDIACQITRDRLNGFVGQAAVDLGIIPEAQRNRALEVESRFLALGRPIPGISAADLANDDTWLNLANTHNVTNEAMLLARRHVMSGGGVPHGFPPLGEVALALGDISREDKNALLAAQAGERTLRATERTRNHFPQPVGEDVFIALVKSPKWQHAGKAGDPPYLQAAQAANFKAEILEAAVAMAPEMLQNSEVNLKMQQAMAALDGIGTTSCMNGAQALSAQHPSAADSIQKAATSAAQEHNVEDPFNFEKTAERMRAADQGMVAALDYLINNHKLSPEALQALSSPLPQQQQSTGHGF